ncbi:MAG: ABC transporter ATP-binding protein [Chloroflexi bacterium]|nr:ABC transporter ATP-binding protein [Chloroflexota bacterium]
MSALSAEGLTARYPGQPTASPALADVCLHVESRERLLLLGPNGAGKSTFIRVFSGLMRPTQGEALVAGQPARIARGSVGVVSHATYLYDELTVLENLRLYAELYGVPRPEPRALDLLGQVGIPHLADMQVGRLSRGQQQRVTIARALLHEPEVLLLDEPETGLDQAAFGVLENVLWGGQYTVVLTTHNLARGLRLGTRAAVLAHGRIVHERRDLSDGHADELAHLVEDLARG